jgi:DNA adenine methylase
MMIAPDAPKRPALRYYGGKWNLAPWIISHFPKHLNYVEPCGGAASVLLQKPRSPLETYNDLSGAVVNFFRVLRERPDDLIRQIRLTPWARAEYEISNQSCIDSIEQARRFYFRSQMAISGSTRSSSGMRMVKEIAGGVPSQINIDHEHLADIAGRLYGVQIENKSALAIIESYGNNNALIYFDPPYVHSERTSTHEYEFEWAIEEHETAADLLRQCAGYVVVSGYACPLYTDLYERHGWQRVDKEAQTNSGGKRIESLWLSPRTQDALDKPQQSNLFTMEVAL